ncbi:molecular chaperone HtpG [Ruminococcaceae bacterium OttesenSCG-928-A11]|nr:molecular chaperone HtpG [Ruminococcaceae bacterium OttesenSCG-928-A11]
MKQFKAESKRLLDLMINSIYTHKEIFLRELISNASDAIDKLYFLSLTDDSVGMTREDFAIRITPDKDAGTLIISDNGVGMDKAALESNLGIIANSGSLAFRKENAGAEDIDIIGQFGVGFYSAFMVAKKVTVISRAFGAEEGWKWESKGVEGYSVTTAERETVGTDIILVLKEDTDDERYSEFLEQYRLEQLVKKYSDYVRYPIKMDMEKSRKKIGSEDEYETVTENTVLNSMVPIWKRSKSEVSDEDYAAFYKEKFSDFQDPAKVIQSSTEGTATYNALLFIPSRPPYDYYTKDFEKGLQLYASGVLIMEKCGDLLPDHFSFVRGLVDSQDVTLNISREMLQHDRQLKLIRASLERKIKNELTAWLANDREKYEEFWKNFGLQLKVGAYSQFGAEADNLKDLLLFRSAKQDKLVTLAEYVEAMPEDQKYIYYAAGDKDSAARLTALPQAGLVMDKGYDLLLLTEDVDEFVLQVMRQYGEGDSAKEFRNISGGDLGLESEDEKKEIEEQNTAHKTLFEAMQKTLEGKVKEVRVSGRLGENPVIITAEGGLSLEMEKVLNSMPAGEKVESTKVLELNPSHPIFEKLKALSEAGDDEKLATYTSLLYDQALMIEGLPVTDPAAYSRTVSALLAE